MATTLTMVDLVGMCSPASSIKSNSKDREPYIDLEGKLKSPNVDIPSFSVGFSIESIVHEVPKNESNSFTAKNPLPVETLNAEQTYLLKICMLISLFLSKTLLIALAKMMSLCCNKLSMRLLRICSWMILSCPFFLRKLLMLV